MMKTEAIGKFVDGAGRGFEFGEESCFALAQFG